jgi:hypothetical protein
MINPSRFGRIPTAIETRGVKRTKLYGMAARHRGLFRKDGSVTMVDLHFLDEILEALPAAEIGGHTGEDEPTAT